jgi:hypothetical protein
MKLGRRLFLATGQISGMGRGIFLFFLSMGCCAARCWATKWKVMREGGVCWAALAGQAFFRC